MKRYLTFGGDDEIDTLGGWEDRLGQSDTPEEAFAQILAHAPAWWQVVDLETGQRLGDPPGFADQVQAARDLAAAQRRVAWEEMRAALKAGAAASIVAAQDALLKSQMARHNALVALVGSEDVAAEIKARVSAPGGA